MHRTADQRTECRTASGLKHDKSARARLYVVDGRYLLLRPLIKSRTIDLLERRQSMGIGYHLENIELDDRADLVARSAASDCSQDRVLYYRCYC